MLLNMNDIIIHHRNIQTLVIELFKKHYDFAPPIMDSLLNRRTICYNFRNLQVLVGKKENCVLWFRNNKLTCTPIMDNFAGRVETKEHNKLFKSDVRQWICNECPCRLCKVLVPNLGFI